MHAAKTVARCYRQAQVSAQVNSQVATALAAASGSPFHKRGGQPWTPQADGYRQGYTPQHDSRQVFELDGGWFRHTEHNSRLFHRENCLKKAKEKYSAATCCVEVALYFGSSEYSRTKAFAAQYCKAGHAVDHPAHALFGNSAFRNDCLNDPTCHKLAAPRAPGNDASGGRGKGTWGGKGKGGKGKGAKGGGRGFRRQAAQ